MGDAVKFLDENDISQGMVFDGRLAEDFKLSSGTWVSVGPLRAKILAHFSPLVRDCVIAGIDRDEAGMLVFADLDSCRRLCNGLPAGANASEILQHSAVLRAFREKMETFAGKATGSSSCVARAMLMEEPPSLDGGEITDKGSLNQRAVLDRRAALVDEMYSDSDRIIRVERSAKS